MKCPNCGAEVKRGQRSCLYCDSDLSHLWRPERPAPEEKRNGRPPEKKTLGQDKALRAALAFTLTAVVLAGVFLLFMVCAVLHLVESNFGGYDGARSKDQTLKERTGLKAVVHAYDREGYLTLKYGGKQYDHIKISDRELVDWLNETEKTLTEVEILFDTDKSGNIKRVAMSSKEFVVLSQEADVYTACRENQVIQFTSEVPLETNTLYEGYFSYPRLHLVSAESTYLFAGSPFDSSCAGKRTVTEKDAYTGEDVTLCQIKYGTKWYYCSQEIYDELQEGSSLDEYVFSDTPPCLIVQ